MKRKWFKWTLCGSSALILSSAIIAPVVTSCSCSSSEKETNKIPETNVTPDSTDLFNSLKISNNQQESFIKPTEKDSIKITNNIININFSNSISFFELDLKTIKFDNQEPNSVITFESENPNELSINGSIVKNINKLNEGLNQFKIKANIKNTSNEYCCFFTISINNPPAPAIPELPNGLPTKPTFDKPTINQTLHQNSGAYTQIGVFKYTDISKSPRTINNNYYDSEAYVKYNADGFKYPAYNYNYEGNKGNNRFFNVGNNVMNAAEIVFNERVTNSSGQYIDANNNIVTQESQKIKYSNPNWILNEIKNNQLKKHRAADGIYEYKILDSVQSVKRHYTISTAMLGPVMLGLYAPAGEVITLTLDDETFDLMSSTNFSGLKIEINQNFWDNKKADVDSGGISNRYPFINTVFKVNPNEKTIKFGTPFGGGISIIIDGRLNYKADPFNKSIENINFTVDGAVPCMLYTDGDTTEQQWNEQIELIKNKQLGPCLQANSSYFAWTLPFTGIDQIAHLNLDQITYPKILFQKWNDFLFLSNYFAGNDLRGATRKLNMCFCDDIWGGAGAWGGGMSFWCPSNWGANAFISKRNPLEIFNSVDSWGVFHEINHNFEQNGAIFKKISHGKTNEVNMFDLSVIGDVGRFRSEMNPNGEFIKDGQPMHWSYLDNAYTTINSVKKRMSKGENGDEYPLQKILLSIFGSKNYADYVRYDQRNGNNGAQTWNSLNEIKDISTALKINFWPALEYYGTFWNDKWPTSYNSATNEQKQIIDSLNQYPAIDFVGNMYAAGSYLYNYETKEFVYTGDSNPAYEIVANNDYVFDFENYVNAVNPNFNWTGLKFDTTTKNNGTLKLDPSNPKRLIYTPPKNNIDVIDEFDISLIPGDWTNKPNNYVPEYKYKIKVRQVVNEPVLETFSKIDTSLDKVKLLDSISSLTNPDYIQPIGSFKTDMFSNINQKEAARIKLNLVIPETGNYTFKASWDDWFRFKVNDDIIRNEYQYQGNLKEIHSAQYNKGDVVKLELDVINTAGSGSVNLEVMCNNNPIDIFTNALIPDYKNVEELKQQSPVDIINDKKFEYKMRSVNHEIFDASLTSSLNLSKYKFNVLNTNDYTLSSKYEKNGLMNLNDYGTNYFELWNKDYTDPKTNEKYAYMSFNVKLKQAKTIKSLLFGNRTNNHSESRATNIKIIGHYQNETFVLYDGKYGSQFDDRKNEFTVLNIPNPKLVDQLDFEMYNTNAYGGLILQWFRMSEETWKQQSNSFSINDRKIWMTEGWELINNDSNDNLSAYNNISAVSKTYNDVIQFTLNNATAFNIIGQINNQPTKMNVYINDELVSEQTIKNTISGSLDNSRQFNEVLYMYENSNNKPIKITIVHKDNNPLYINYFMTFGNNTYIS